MIDFGQPDVPPRGVRVSIFVVGLGLLLLLSLLIPHFQVPFLGDRYWQWLSGITVILGGFALLRGERGRLGLACAVATLGAAGVLTLTVVVPFVYSVAMRLFMPD